MRHVSLCAPCFLQGYCSRLIARPVTGAELRNGEFVRDLRLYASQLRIACDRWTNYLIDAYRDHPGIIVTSSGAEIELDTSVFDNPHQRYWFRDFCKPVPAGVIPHIRREARERVRVMATILRAIDPRGTALWGIRAANDVEAVTSPLSASVRTLLPCHQVGRKEPGVLIRYGGRELEEFPF